MAKVKITRQRVEALREGASIWDTDVRGFGARRRTTDGAPVFVLKYFALNRQRFATIGPHGSPWTCDSARNEAQRLLGEVAKGNDVAGDRSRSKAAPTVADLGAEFIERHANTKLKPGTRANYEAQLRLYVYPAMGRMKAEAVRHGDVAKLHHVMRAQPYAANRTLALVSKLFNWAAAQGYRPHGANPALGVERYRERRCERFLSEAEIARLGQTLVELEGSGEVVPHAVAAVRVLLLTGARRDEIVKAKWEYLDLERGLLLLPDSKTGQKAIQLSAPAALAIASVPRLVGNPFIFCGTKAGRPISDLTGRWQRIRERAGLPDVRLHDLRHSYASLVAGRGGSLVMIGALLGHVNPSTTWRYTHLAADPLRELNNRVGTGIERSLAGESNNDKPDNVKAFRR